MPSGRLIEQPRTPTVGMRGGLGRTLLTAFLIMAIVPLSAISWYATQCERLDVQREVMAKLSSVAAMMETQVREWADSRMADLALLAALPATQTSLGALVTANHQVGESVNCQSVGSADRADQQASCETLRAQLHALLMQEPAFRRLAILDSDGQVLVSAEAGSDQQVRDPLAERLPRLNLEQVASLQSITFGRTDDMGVVVTQPITSPDGERLGLLVGWLDPGDLIQLVQPVSEMGDTGEIYLVDVNGLALPQAQVVTSPGIQAALAGENGEGLYEDYAGVPVIGVYRRVPELGLVLVAEQAQEEAFATTDTVTAAVVGATLVVALVTAVIAAIVTRQITRPVVRLTESALRIAEGDLGQCVPVTSRDEIGILTYVFNRMAAELKTLYDDLEDKVAQRTALLQKANYQIQRRAIQLATTVEVSQAATSILEPDQLLPEVVRLIQARFAYFYVGIYLLDDDRRQAILQEARGGGRETAAVKAKPVPVGDEGAVGRAALTGQACIVKWEPEHAQEVFSSPYIRAEAALPLKIGDQVIGVLDILSTEEEDFDADDVSVLQNVANQITIALENARVYAMEREAVKRLQELDRSKRRFLANMSHELRTPLTNIIGFSRLMLKGIDGPLTEQQQSDLQIIYHNGQHLLGLINDLLDVSHIEAGLMELQFREVDIADLIRSVMATASALVRDKDIEMRQEIAPGLPMVQADATRIRQVLLRLMENAAKFTERGEITVRAWSADGQVLVSISDTGVGIPPEDQERIFQRFEQGSMENGRRPNGAGLGLALSKEFVQRHGGEIWVESEVGKGSTFTFSLPLQPGSEQSEI